MQLLLSLRLLHHKDSVCTIRHVGVKQCLLDVLLLSQFLQPYPVTEGCSYAPKLHFQFS